MNDSTSDQVPFKTCSKCGKHLPATTDYFPKAPEGKYGLRGDCKACVSEIQKEYRNKNQEAIRQKRHTYYENNKEVIVKRVAIWQSNNVDKVKVYKQKHVANNRERVNARIYKWQRDNAEQYREIKRKFYHRTKAHFKERTLRWKAQNPDKVRSYKQRRRARERSFPSDFVDTDWQHALDYFNGCCAYCNTPPGFLNHMIMVMEHYVPLSNPNCPGTVPTNIVPACKACNSSKGDKSPEQWLTQKFGKRKAKQIVARIRTYFDSLRE